MKLAKKFSLLVALALIVTVGGVYATWNYAQGDVGQAAANLVPKLAGYATTTTKGTIAIDTTGLTIMIDDTNADHNAELVLTGSVKVSFTPSQGADATVVQNGIPMQYQLRILMNDGITEWKYEGADIFTVNEDVVSMGTVKEYTITADALMQKITLGSFKLDTLEDYESFNTVLGRAQIQITVSEVVAP